MKKKLLLIVCLSFLLSACGNRDTVEETKNNLENEVEAINSDKIEEEVTLIEHTPED